MRPSYDQIKPMQLLYLIPSPAPNDHMADSSHTYNSIKWYLTRIINSYEWKFHNFKMPKGTDVVLALQSKGRLFDYQLLRCFKKTINPETNRLYEPRHEKTCLRGLLFAYG